MNITRANKSLLGGGYKPAREDENNTHIILSQEDYDAIQARIEGLESKISSLKIQYSDSLSARDHNARIVQQEYERSLAQVRQEVETQKAAVVAAERKNDNLLRILRERANSVRGLYPKKERSGYLLQSVEQYSYTRRRSSRIIEAWRVRLQSPYPITLAAISAQSSIFEDLVEHGVGYDLGIDTFDDGSLREIIEAAASDPSENIAYAFKYRGGSRGYWEIEFLTTRPVTITEDLLQN